MNPNNQKLSKAIANTLYAGVNKAALLNSEFETPKWGYIVSLKEGPTFKTVTDVEVTKVAEFVEKNMSHPPMPVHYFGVYIHPETREVHFTVCEQCARLEFATEVAKKSGFNSIFDVEKERLIKI